MPRISKALAEERSDKAFTAFLDRPPPTVKEVQAMLARDYGFSMNLSHIYKLRNKAIAIRAEEDKK